MAVVERFIILLAGWGVDLWFCQTLLGVDATNGNCAHQVATRSVFSGWTRFDDRVLWMGAFAKGG